MTPLRSHRSRRSSVVFGRSAPRRNASARSTSVARAVPWLSALVSPVIVAASSASCAGAAFSSIRCSTHSRTRAACRTWAGSPVLTSRVSVPSAASSASQAWNQPRAVRKESSAERMAASRPSASRCRSAGRSLSGGPRRSSSWARPCAGGLADGLVEVGEAHREHADALRTVLAGDPDDGAAFPVIGGLDRDRAGQVAAGALKRAAGRVEEALVLGAGVPRGSGVFGGVLVRHVRWGPRLPARCFLSVHSTEAGTQCRRSRTERASRIAKRPRPAPRLEVAAGAGQVKRLREVPCRPHPVALVPGRAGGGEGACQVVG